MTPGDQSIPVHVEVLSFASLFNESAFPLAVDTYQRGFVWKDDKVRQLADDLSAYQQEADLPFAIRQTASFSAAWQVTTACSA